MKVIVVYESKYGNTKRVAEEITEGMNEIGEIDIFLKELKEVNLENVTDYDAILIGSRNHMGGATKSIKGFIEELGKLQLNKKMFTVFDTYIKKRFRKGRKEYGETNIRKSSRIKTDSSWLINRSSGSEGSDSGDRASQMQRIWEKNSNST